MNDTGDMNFRTEGVVKKILDSAFAVREEAGLGTMDTVYEACLCREMTSRKMSFLRLKPLPFVYKGERLEDLNYGSYLLVEDEVFVEVSSNFVPTTNSQILSWLNLSKKKTALSINFTAADMKDGVNRIDLKDGQSQNQI